MEKKSSDDYLDDIGKKVYKLTWEGALWGKDGAIAWSRMRFLYLEAMGRAGDGASALSSTYYTAAGNAFSQVSYAGFLRKFLWFFCGFWCIFRALSWSNYAERKAGFAKMSPGQLDVRASILAKWHRYGKAERCLRRALEDGFITRDTRTLVLCKLGEVRDKRGKDDGGIFFGEAERIKNVKNTTRVRVLKALGSHMLRQKKNKPLDYKDAATMFLKEALEIAECEKLGDQIVKIRVLIKKAEG